MSYFLAVHNTYTTVEIGLFANDQLIDHIALEHKLASKELMVTIAHLLARHTRSLTDLQFIAAHQGPGPFTTVRVVISSVNGLAFATGLSLVGINGMEVLVLEQHSKTNSVVVGLLNAFGNDLYFGIAHQQKMHTIGYKPATALLHEIAQEYPNQDITFVGNGTTLHRVTIQEIFGSRAQIPDPLPEYCTLEQLGKHAYEQWCDGTKQAQLQPLYIKPHLIHTK